MRPFGRTAASSKVYEVRRPGSAIIDYPARNASDGAADLRSTMPRR
ncbi:hypothetical protein J2X98_004078 [Pseudarthrobacter enclensis]|uniref:Uncharacterized protein n=1 Tax=Pseudarthrobacter enclensis TaxID=993070 RepID=A0ABT9RZ14_9MICC|nr:hypothetical protein [Pseudarthrobacter enclensis]